MTSRSKVTKFIYENATNQQSRKVLPTSENNKIVLKNGLAKIDYYNFGFQPDTRDWFIRVRFVGSDRWYELKIGFEEVDDWFTFFKEQTKHKKKSMFGGEDDEDEEW